jgi:soluble P-type ATPase
VRSDWRPAPKLIALDIDGTILRSGQPVSPRVHSAISRAMASDAHVVVATGRPVISARPVLAELGMTEGYVLCSNGAVRMCAATGEFLEVQWFDAGPVVRRLHCLLPGALFAVEQLGEQNLATGEFPEFTAIPPLLVDHETLVAAPVPRLTVWWPGHTSAEMAHEVRSVQIPGVRFTLDQEPWLVAVSAGVSKGSALERLRLELGVPAESTLAVGDGDNDEEMLRWAAHSVAMGQAPISVRAIAVEVTGTVDEDGLATVLERWYI